MDTQTAIIAYAIGALVGLYILYEIIQAAVKSGTKGHKRAVILWMIKNGMSPREIKEAMEADEKDFWKQFEKQ